MHLIKDLLSFSNMSQVVYTRVSDSLKEAVDQYSQDRGVTLTSGVVELLGRGMAAAADERSVAALESSLAKARAEKAEIESKLATAAGEVNSLRAFVERVSNASIGACPNLACGKGISGYELLALGQCNNCHQSLTELLAPPRSTPSLNEREVGLLLGALGVVLIGIGIAGSSGR